MVVFGAIFGVCSLQNASNPGRKAALMI